MTRNKNRKRSNKQRSYRRFISNAKDISSELMQFDLIINKLPKEDESSYDSDKPFNCIRKTSPNLIEYNAIIRNDGTPTEIPIPKFLNVFLSYDGKLMIQKKVDGNEEEKPSKEKEEKPITYEDIAKELFMGKKIYFSSGNSVCSVNSIRYSIEDYDNCTNEAQVKRMLAFNKLQNIAKSINLGWKPDFNEDECKFFIYLDNGYMVGCNTFCNTGLVFFKSEELAKEAIRIMGEESLNDLFNTDW